jgi:PAS domain S-box-containing protein
MVSNNIDIDFVRSLFSSINVAFTVLNEHDNIVIYNEAAEKLFGDDANEVLDKSVYIFHPDEKVESVRKEIDLFRTGKKTIIYKSFKENEKIIVEKLIAIRDAEGKYKGLVQIADYRSEFDI